MMSFSSRVTFLFSLLVSGTFAAPSEIGGNLSPVIKNYSLRTNEVRDSPLERVQVKQETGFDGRVRAIRFSSEPEQDRRNEGINPRLSSPNNFNSYPIRVTYDQNIGLPTMRMIQLEEDSRELPFSELTLLTAVKSSRPKREAKQTLPKNEVDDLETAEANVFRPLFVYRQQVSRRLKLRNEKKANNNFRRVPSRANPRFNSYSTPYYYPYYRYSPGYTYYY